MRKIISVILALITVISLIACNEVATPTTPSTPSKPSTPSTPKDNESDDNPDDNPTEPEAEKILFADEGAVKLRVTLPETLTVGVKHAATRLGVIVEEMTGVKLDAGGEGLEYELHLGVTDDVAKGIYDALDGERFAIKTVEKKIYVVAGNDWWLYDAIEYFAEKYLSSDEYAESGEGKLFIKKEIDETAEAVKDTFRYRISKGGELVASVEAVATAENKYYVGQSSSVPYRRQGGCFDGTYMYQALISKSEECARIMKKNVLTGETTFSELRTDMGHANSMGYNPDENELMVGDGNNVLIFDAENLQYKKTVKTSVAASRGITYDPIAHQYVVRYFLYRDAIDGADVRVIDHDKSVNLSDYNAYQGTACDGYFVGALLAHSKKGTNGGYNCHIATYSTDGTYIGTVKVEIPGGLEPESASIVNGELYVVACTTQPVVTLYKVVFDNK